MQTADTRAIGYEALVNYAGFDGFKIACQEGGRPTASNLLSKGFRELSWSRGESAYIMQTPRRFPWFRQYLAHVEEGLGTKHIPAGRMAALVREAVIAAKIAAEMQRLTGKSFFREISQCNCAMVLNDLTTSGADPISFLLHLAVENASWFEDEQRWREVIQGTALACNLAGCSWGGGETPVLRGTIEPLSCLLSGSAVGFIRSHKRLINPASIRSGDSIIMFSSSGPHANGYTMLWDVVAPRLPDGYLTVVPGDGRTFGEAILAPTFIYSKLIQAILDAGISIHYAVNITGHGWCKLMRAIQPFLYIIDRMPKHQPVFDMIAEVNPIGIKKMLRTFNYGGGFAIYLDPRDVRAALNASRGIDPDIEIFLAGHIEKADERAVRIDPLDVDFGPKDLEIR